MRKQFWYYRISFLTYNWCKQNPLKQKCTIISLGWINITWSFVMRKLISTSEIKKSIIRALVGDISYFVFLLISSFLMKHHVIIFQPESIFVSFCILWFDIEYLFLVIQKKFSVFSCKQNIQLLLRKL